MSIRKKSRTRSKGAAISAEIISDTKAKDYRGPEFKALRSKRTLRHKVSLVALLLDIIAIASAYTVASLAYLSYIEGELILRTLGSILPIYFLFGLTIQIYPAHILMVSHQSVRRSATAMIWASLLMFVIFFFLKISEEFSRVVLGLGTLLAVCLITIARMNVARMARMTLQLRPFAHLSLIDGVDMPTQPIEGSVRTSDCGLSPSPEDPAMLDLLGRLAFGLDGVVVYCKPESRERWAFMLKSLDIRTEIVVPELNRLQPLAIEERQGNISLILGNGQLSLSQRALKRSFDLAFALALTPILLPILGGISLLVKLDSPGPIFFKQERIGLSNRKFLILKFRTMRREMLDDKARKTTTREDARITRIGHFLRRTSLDELPQFINVLRGEMSIVGPRPHAELTAVGSSMLWEIDMAYWHRHVVKPGITGLAQVRGHRGSLFEPTQLKERLNADLEYVANWSLTNDLAIILRTLSVMIHKNAF